MIDRYTLPAMAALWSERHKLDLWKRIEALALEAWEERGTVPVGAAAAVAAAPPIDIEAWKKREAALRHDVAAFVDELAAAVPDHGRWVHYGLTSSDVLDTALAATIVAACRLIGEELDELLHVVRDQAFRHRSTLMVGRTHGMWAEPTTFGIKLAGWAFEIDRNRTRIDAAASRAAAAKLSGPIGTYSRVSPDVEAHVCGALGLDIEPAATQVVARDRHAEVLSALALVGGMLERFAIEIRHLQRTEVAEVAEGFADDQKGSSAMPHKRNPIAAENVTGLARLLRAYAGAGLEDVALWHERDISHSSVERVALPDAFAVAHFALNRMADVVTNLVVDVERMRDRVDSDRGTLFSQALLLALVDQGLERDEAYRLVQRHSADETGHLHDLIAADPEAPITPEQLKAIFDLDTQLANTDVIFDRLAGL